MRPRLNFLANGRFIPEIKSRQKNILFKLYVRLYNCQHLACFTCLSTQQQYQSKRLGLSKATVLSCSGCYCSAPLSSRAS